MDDAVKIKTVALIALAGFVFSSSALAANAGYTRPAQRSGNHVARTQHNATTLSQQSSYTHDEKSAGSVGIDHDLPRGLSMIPWQDPGPMPAPGKEKKQKQ